MIEWDWRALERARVASGVVIYRPRWVCSHGPHDIPTSKYDSRQNHEPRVTAWHQKFRLRGALTGASA